MQAGPGTSWQWKLDAGGSTTTRYHACSTSSTSNGQGRRRHWILQLSWRSKLPTRSGLVATTRSGATIGNSLRDPPPWWTLSVWAQWNIFTTPKGRYSTQQPTSFVILCYFKLNNEVILRALYQKRACKYLINQKPNLYQNFVTSTSQQWSLCLKISE